MIKQETIKIVIVRRLFDQDHKSIVGTTMIDRIGFFAGAFPFQVFNYAQILFDFGLMVLSLGEKCEQKSDDDCNAYDMSEGVEELLGMKILLAAIGVALRSSLSRWGRLRKLGFLHIIF
jgi:hypothetical protein